MANPRIPPVNGLLGKRGITKFPKHAHHKHWFVPSFLLAHTLVSLNGHDIEAIRVFLSAFEYRFRNGLQHVETSCASLLPGGSRDFGIPRK